MRFRALVFAITLATPALADDCPRAIILSNEADAVRAVVPDDAISKYEQALVLAPTNHAIAWKLALVYAKMESWAKVAATLEHACAIAPTFANYFNLRGVALLEWAREARAPALFRDARAAFEQAIRLDATFAAPHEKLAEILLRDGDDAGALAQYTTAIKLRPENAAAYVSLAGLYVQLGYLDFAAAVAREGLTRSPGAQVHFALAMTYGAALEEKHDAGAIARYEDARAACGVCNDSGNVLVFLALGRAYAHAKPPRVAEAKQSLLHFEKAICKGAAAQRYANQCIEVQELMKGL